MAACIFTFLFLISYLSLNISALVHNGPPAKCGDSGPDIRPPFWLQGRQPEHLGQPGFELFCKENRTMIKLSSYGGDLIVGSISYDTKKINLVDPNSCVHEVFLNLNLSQTPFQYHYHVKNYTYLNCSAQISSSFREVPCLSSSEYHVYTVESAMDSRISCVPLKTVAVPFSYSPYIYDDTFGLSLTWNLQSRTEHQTGLSNKHLVMGLVIGIFALIVAIILISIKIHNSKKWDSLKSFGDHYEALKIAECSKVDV